MSGALSRAWQNSCVYSGIGQCSGQQAGGGRAGDRTQVSPGLPFGPLWPSCVPPPPSLKGILEQPPRPLLPHRQVRPGDVSKAVGSVREGARPWASHGLAPALRMQMQLAWSEASDLPLALQKLK